MKKTLLSLFICTALATTSLGVAAQGNSVKELPRGWQLLDKETDGYYGLSMKKAYDFVKGKKTKTVIVAVIDSGVDTLHEDLKDVLWTNPREIPGNGIDDDGNGYVDDVHGWNFLGGKDGRNVKEDSYEGARVYHQLKKIWGDKTVNNDSLSPEQKEEYQDWLKVRETVEVDASGSGVDVLMMQRAMEACFESDSVLRQGIGKETYTGIELDKYSAVSVNQQRAKAILLGMFKMNKVIDMSNKDFLSTFKEQVEGEIRKKESVNTPPRDYRGEIVKDNEEDINDRFYGNNDIMAGTSLHGTHVSGIIAAKRNNGKGIDGIADDVRIMTVRAVPDGDEHDKDIALAIRYAVDNGAKVINMSFGKSFSPHKGWIDDAVTYADSKGVLLVHAAGNDAKDVDSTDNFPNATLRKSQSRATNWITVGASSDPLAEPGTKSYAASFSNYGKKEVNVFAPGTKIYSSLPGGNVYGNESGTSMASPVVAGVAAFILSYYPSLSAKQVKFVIEKSATTLPAKVKLPGSERLVSLSDISTSGGIINAYQAIKLASTLKPERQPLPTSTLNNKVN